MELCIEKKKVSQNLILREKKSWELMNMIHQRW